MVLGVLGGGAEAPDRVANQLQGKQCDLIVDGECESMEKYEQRVLRALEIEQQRGSEFTCGELAEYAGLESCSDATTVIDSLEKQDKVVCSWKGWSQSCVLKNQTLEDQIRGGSDTQ